MLARLEVEICRRFDAAAAVCVPMARTGLYLALEQLIRPGQTVVMSPLTIVDVVNAVILAGGIPLFADIQRRSCSMDPDQAESLIDERTGAVLITHLHGETAGAHRFREICDRRSVPLIEDVAQAFGAVEGDRRLGTIGNVGVYSFGYYKNVNAWRGGMIVSQDSGLIAGVRQRLDQLSELSGWRLLAISLHGLLTEVATWPPFFALFTHRLLRFAFLHDVRCVTRYLDPEVGARRLMAMPARYLLRMTPRQAELAFDQLDCVDLDTATRIAHAGRYHEGLAGLAELITPDQHQGWSQIYTCYPIQFRRREALLRYATSARRDFAAQHLRNCADLPEFREFHRDCPNARAAARELILLPTYPGYPAEEIQRNIQVIREFLGTSTDRITG